MFHYSFGHLTIVSSVFLLSLRENPEVKILINRQHPILTSVFLPSTVYLVIPFNYWIILAAKPLKVLK